MQYFSYKFTLPSTLSIGINLHYHTRPFKLVHSLLFSQQCRIFLSARPYNLFRIITYFDPNYHTFLFTLSTRLTFYATTIHSFLYYRIYCIVLSLFTPQHAGSHTITPCHFHSPSYTLTNHTIPTSTISFRHTATPYHIIMPHRTMHHTVMSTVSIRHAVTPCQTS